MKANLADHRENQMAEELRQSKGAHRPTLAPSPRSQISSRRTYVTILCQFQVGIPSWSTLAGVQINEQSSVSTIDYIAFNGWFLCLL